MADAALSPPAAPAPLAAAPSDWAARPSPTGLFQLVALLWAYALYDLLRVGAAGSMAAATAHSHQVTSVEHFFGIDIEQSVQRAALHWSWLIDACNVGYTVAHLVVPPLTLWLLYRHAPAHYRYWRNVLLVLLAIAVLGFWLYPMGPPWLMHGSGLVGTSHGYVSLNHTPIESISSPSGTTLAAMNPVAAMPSLHVGVAVWAALALGSVLRRRAARLLAALYPVAMVVVVVVTGNHWLLDAVGGVAAALLAWAMVAAVSGAPARAPASASP